MKRQLSTIGEVASRQGQQPASNPGSTRNSFLALRILLRFNTSLPAHSAESELVGSALNHVADFEGAARADGDAGHRVLGDVAGDARLLGQQAVKVADERAAAREDDAPVNDVAD